MPLNRLAFKFFCNYSFLGLLKQLFLDLLLSWVIFRLLFTINLLVVRGKLLLLTGNSCGVWLGHTRQRRRHRHLLVQHFVFHACHVFLRRLKLRSYIFFQRSSLVLKFLSYLVATFGDFFLYDPLHIVICNVFISVYLRCS